MKTMNKLTAVVRIMTMAILLALTACSGDEWMDKAEDTQVENLRTISVNIGLPGEKPGFNETDSRNAASTDWTDGDELLMAVTLDAGTDQKYSAYVTLSFNGTDWTVTQGSKLIAAETLTLDGTLELSIPENITQEVTAEVEFYYAPECTWVNNSLTPKADAMTTAPECWYLMDGSWTTDAARLRIHTGIAGDVLTLTADDTGFDALIKGDTCIHNYTAITDADGDAYFYCTVEKATCRFYVNLKAERTMDNGSKVTADVPVLEASPLVPVTLESGKSYKVDFASKRANAIELRMDQVTSETGYEMAFDGTYLVYNYNGLMAWYNSRDVLSSNMKLMADITLPTEGITVTDGQPSGSNWTPLGSSDNPFTGMIDGSDKNIFGLRISSESNYTGLVSHLGSGGIIKNLTLSDAVIHSTATYTGGITGAVTEGTVSNCYVSAGITGAGSVGGITGNIEEGTVSNCYLSASITGAENVGGIVGRDHSGTVSDCTVKGTVTSTKQVGGIVGISYDSIVTDCTNKAKVTGTGTTENIGRYIAGIVGYTNGSTVTGCINSGNVTGSDTAEGGAQNIAGIVGYTQNGFVYACGNTAAITGSAYTGGIVGHNNYGITVTACWTVDTQEKDYNGTDVTDGKDGIGDNIKGTITACYSFADASAVTPEAISAMNTAIGNAGLTYQWQAGSSWPTLTNIER